VGEVASFSGYGQGRGCGCNHSRVLAKQANAFMGSVLLRLIPSTSAQAPVERSRLYMHKVAAQEGWRGLVIQFHKNSVNLKVDAFVHTLM
jgi:hypothetical protein